MRWHGVFSWNVAFAIMATLCYFGFQECWEQEGNAWRYFQKKLLNKRTVKRLIFYKSGTSLQLKWGKLPAKARQNKRLTAPLQPLVVKGELRCDCVSTKNNLSNKNDLFWPLKYLAEAGIDLPKPSQKHELLWPHSSFFDLEW